MDIEFDKTKIEVIKKLLTHMNVKGVRNFLGHAGFYRRYVIDFLKIVQPLNDLLAKDAPLLFIYDCLIFFYRLKRSFGVDTSHEATRLRFVIRIDV